MKITDHNFAVLENDTHVSKWIEQQGRMDTDRVVDRVCGYLNPGDVVVDAGANIGSYSWPFKRAVGPTGRVIAFEPNPAAFECLRHNCPDVECHQCALSDKSGVLHLALNNENVGATHVAPAGVEIAAMTLDEIAAKSDGFDRCKLLKIDVEGMEPRVLDGARGVIAAMRPIIFIECNRGALARQGFEPYHIIWRMMSLHGYCELFLEPHHSFDMPQVDVFFLPP